MRKVSLIAAAALLGWPATVNAEPVDQLYGKKASALANECHIVYKDGARIICPEAGFETQLNTLIQASYNYFSWDESYIRNLDDKSSFEVDRARIDVTGSIADGLATYRLQNDFVGDRYDPVLSLADESAYNRRDSELLDAWVQLNWGPEGGARLGQFRLPFGLQQRTAEWRRQLATDSVVSRYFDPGYDIGAMAVGHYDMLNFYAAVSNGDSYESENFFEGPNRTGTDPNVLGSASVDITSEGYDRATEGDIKGLQELGYTIGLSGNYGQGDVTFDELTDNFDTIELGADAGIKVAGFSLAGEVMWQRVELDKTDASDDTVGFYLQSGYFIVPEEWELAGRFGYIDFDADNTNVKSVEEYTVGLGKYFVGHHLKVLTGVTFERYDLEFVDDTVLDFQYDLQVTGFF